MQQRVVVIGAGVAGLVAAHRLSVDTGAEVIVLEAAERLGGQLHTTEFAGRPTDVGAEALYLNHPVLQRIVDELDLTGRLVPANRGTTLLATETTPRPMPDGVGPTGPTKLLPVLRSGILSAAGVLRAGREPLHTQRRLDAGDVSVGDFLTHRFGREVVDRFVAPMLGNLHSGDVDRLSLRATAPQLVRAATEGTSLLRAKRPAAGTGGGPAFVSFADGLATFVDALAAGLDVRTSTPAERLERTRDGWRVHTGTDTIDARAVIVATPAHAAAGLLDQLAPVRRPLTVARTAQIATIVCAYRRADADDALAALYPKGPVNGLMVPPHLHRLMKAATILGNKWPQAAHPDLLLVRLSAGRVGQSTVARLNDDLLATRVQNDFAELTGLDAAPVETRVVRWTVPQAEVGHITRLRRIRNSLAVLPPLALAGAPYDGIGLGSVVGSGNAAAEQIGHVVG